LKGKRERREKSGDIVKKVLGREGIWFLILGGKDDHEV
jgi:hypothetical protein